MSTAKAASNFFVMESLYGDSPLFQDKNTDIYNPSNPDYTGEYFNAYHEMLTKIDYDKIPPLLELGTDTNLFNLSFNGKKDIIGSLKSYELICEILLREEINPQDSEMQLKPYHLYGTWWNETGMQRSIAKDFDPFSDVIKVDSNPGYRGPFQMDKSYDKASNTDFNYAVKMYSYISKQENPDITNRVLRILPEQLSDTPKMSSGIVGSTYDPVDEAYVKEYYSNLSYSLNPKSITQSPKGNKYGRPNTEFFPDATYTLLRKLRDAYNRKDLYTLQSNYSDLDYLKSNYEKYIPEKYKTEDNLSDLYYLYALQLNSGKISAHMYNPDLTTPDTTRATMPKLYFDMIKEYGSVNVVTNGLITGWKEQPKLANKMFGVSFLGSGHMYDRPIIETDNLIDNMDKLQLTFSNNDLRNSVATSMKSVPNKLVEYELSFFYGLRAIAQGYMIENSIEDLIYRIYDKQVNDDTIEDNNIQDKPDADASGVTSTETLIKFLQKQNVSSPFEILEGDTPRMTHISHNAEYACSIHKNHPGEDYVAKASTPIISIYDGVVVKVDNYNSIYGVNVLVEHKIGEISMFSHYSHMSRNSVAVTKGDTISKGQKIGIIGTTGYSTGVHLDIELYVFGKNNIKEFFGYSYIGRGNK